MLKLFLLIYLYFSLLDQQVLLLQVVVDLLDECRCPDLGIDFIELLKYVLYALHFAIL